MWKTGTLLAALFLILATGAALGSRAWAQTYPPPVGSVTVASASTTPLAGDSTELTATVRDNEGNPIADQDVTFSITSQPGNDASLGSLSKTVKTDQNGVAKVSLFAGSTPGNIVVEIVAGEKTSQLTIQVLGALLPVTGGPPPEDERDVAYWLIALIAAGAITMTGALAILARRRRS